MTTANPVNFHFLMLLFVIYGAIIYLNLYFYTRRSKARILPFAKETMICKKCGQELPDSIKFCSACGSAVEEITESQQEIAEAAEVPEIPESQQEIAEAAEVPEIPVTPEASVFATPEFDSKKAAENPGSKKKKLIITSIVVAVALIAVVLIIMNLNSGEKKSRDDFASDADYLHYVESETFDDVAGSLSSFLCNFDFDPKQAASSEIKFNISEDLMTLLADIGMSVDDLEALKWLNEVSFVADSAFDGKNMQLKLAATSDGNKLLTGDMVADYESGELHISLPELTEGVLTYDMPNFDASITENLDTIRSTITELRKILPSETALSNLFSRYLKVAFNSIKNVSSSDETLEIDGIEEDCMVLRFTIDTETTINMAKAVLKEARNDMELKNLIERLLKFIRKYNSDMPDINLNAVYSDGIDQLLNELEHSGNSFRNEEFFTLCDYIVDSEVVGRSIEVRGEEVFRYLTLHDGNDFSFELYVKDSFNIHGKGTVENNILSARYTITGMIPDNSRYGGYSYGSYSETELFHVDVSDFDLSKLEKGYVCGDFRLTLSDDVLDTLDSSVKLMSPSLGVVVNHSKDNIKLTLNVYTHDKPLGGITIDCDYGKTPKISIPSGTEFNGDSSIDVLEWAESLELDDLKSSFERSNAPDVILNGIDNLQNELNGMNEVSSIEVSEVPDYSYYGY